MGCNNTIKTAMQGVLDIMLVQGDDQDVQLNFEPPFVLNDYEVTMDIKRAVNVQLKPLFRKTVDNGGLTQVGNTLYIHLDDDFYRENSIVYNYDIAFKHKTHGFTQHLIKGKIFVNLTVTKI